MPNVAIATPNGDSAMDETLNSVEISFAEGLPANDGVDIGDVDVASIASTTAAATAVVPTQIIKTVTATATPEALAADGTFFRMATVIGVKAARTNNAGIVYLGIGATNDTQPYAINPGESITIEAPVGAKYDLNDWYLDVLNAADGVAVIYS